MINDKNAAIIAQKFIDAIQNGTVDGTWVRPWNVGDNGMPHNPVSDKPFTGTNAFILLTNGGGQWATFKQWKKLGAQVLKREDVGPGTHVLRPIIKKDPANPLDDGVLLGFKPYVVFSANLVSGYEAPVIEKPEFDFQSIERAEKFIKATGASIRYDEVGVRGAYYSPGMDSINMPAKSLFKSEEGFYSTICHELAHWSGHESRLDRKLNHGRFGDEAYSFEELVAEFTSTFLCAHLGVHQGFRDNHAKYLKSWVKVLKDEPTALTSAASMADKAFNYLKTFDVVGKDKIRAA